MLPLIVISADKEILELGVESGFAVRGFLDPKNQGPVLDFSCLGGDEDFHAIQQAEPALRVALAIDPCALKARLYPIYKASLQTVISQAAVISPSAKVGEGAIIQMGAKILSDVAIGKCCKVNVNAVVHHDCRIGDFCTLAPGSLLLGRVDMGDRVYVGSGAIILPRRKIGSDVTIGAGAVVTHDIESGATVVGVPARWISGT